MCAYNLDTEDKSKAKEDLTILLAMKLQNQLSQLMEEGLNKASVELSQCNFWMPVPLIH